MANTQNQPSTDLSVRMSTDLAQLSELERILMTDEEVDVVQVVTDPAEAQREITARLLAAESDVELEQMGALSWTKDLVGVPVVIHGFRWAPSDYQGQEGSPSIFFIVQVERLDNGEKVVVTVGSRNVLAQLVNLAKRGRLPGAVRLIKPADRKTAKGYTPFWLVTPDGHPGHVGEEAAA